MKRNKKYTAYRFGLQAETLACLLLLLKGYRILARRYRNHAGEIDIIALRHKTVLFVEVKARKQGAVVETPSTRQQQRILRAATLFLRDHPRLQQHYVRFDIVIIRPFCWPVHLKNAWQG